MFLIKKRRGRHVPAVCRRSWIEISAIAAKPHFWVLVNRRRNSISEAERSEYFDNRGRNLGNLKFPYFSPSLSLLLKEREREKATEK